MIQHDICFRYLKIAHHDNKYYSIYMHINMLVISNNMIKVKSKSKSKKISFIVGTL